MRTLAAPPPHRLRVRPPRGAVAAGPDTAFPDTDTDIDVLEDIEIDLDELLDEHSRLVVYNDDVNTFDWVITSLVEIIGHDTVQAEQLAMLIHFKGKATVKSGSHEELQPLKDGLCDRELSAVIEGPGKK